MDTGADWASLFAQVSRDLLAAPEDQVTHQRIVDLAVDVVPACDWSVLSLRGRRGRLETVAATSLEVAAVESWQHTAGEGPGSDDTSAPHTWLVQDLRADGRWPGWAEQAVAAGIGAVLGVRLTTGSGLLGTLSLYAARTSAFDADSVRRAELFASHAATAADTARLVTGLRAAVESRHLIGLAQGVIMQRYDMGVEASFDVLRRYSSHANVKLREVAQRVVELRLLPQDYVELLGPDAPTE